MKSDHRHELKTNELADWLAHFPQWVKENRMTLIGAAVVIVVAAAVYFRVFYQKSVVSARAQSRLTGLVTQLPSQKGAIARSLSQGTDQSYVLLDVARDLREFAQGEADDEMAALALIDHAEAIRAELHYRLGDVGKAELTKQIALAQTSYQTARERASATPRRNSAWGCAKRSWAISTRPGRSTRTLPQTPTMKGRSERWRPNIVSRRWTITRSPSCSSRLRHRRSRRPRGPSYR